ncbi:MAG: methyltransferase domain-containing protein [Candidatus Omnitrophica bacterium]|nr:methyltransferase domain-containing protein [Candidatus Omnitrophota bacterium]
MDAIWEFTDKEIKANRRVFEERTGLYRKKGLDLLKAREIILKRSGKLKGKILEIGTGRGVTALALARAGHRITSVDNDRGMLKVAALNLCHEKLLSKASFRVMDAYSLEFKDRSFDNVFVVEALHHLYDAERFFGEVDRVLSDRGKLILADFNTKGKAIIGHVHLSEGRKHKISPLGKREAKSWLIGHGYEIKIYDEDCHWVIIAEKTLKERRKLGKGIYEHIYGPVPSWRLGASLGIDPISSDRKMCNFDCVYCQLGRTKGRVSKRKTFIAPEKILEELKCLPPVTIDYITFSGTGEPTMAANLGEMIREVKKIRREPVAVLTNSSYLCDRSVRKALLPADLVAVKLDAPSEELFQKINRPARGLTLKKVIKGIKAFRREYKGKLALQMMFLEYNFFEASEMASLARDIGADEVELNTPLRPCAVKSLTRKEMEDVKRHFRGSNAISVYEKEKNKVRPISDKETMRRRGKKI